MGSPPNTSDYLRQASLERSSGDIMSQLSIIRASILEYERTQQIFENISTRTDVTDTDRAGAEALATQAKTDFEEARRTHYEVYKTYYRSGDSQDEQTAEVPESEAITKAGSTRRKPDYGGVTIRTRTDGPTHGTLTS